MTCRALLLAPGPTESVAKGTEIHRRFVVYSLLSLCISLSFVLFLSLVCVWRVLSLPGCPCPFAPTYLDWPALIPFTVFGMAHCLACYDRHGVVPLSTARSEN